MLPGPRHRSASSRPPGFAPGSAGRLWAVAVACLVTVGAGGSLAVHAASGSGGAGGAAAVRTENVAAEGQVAAARSQGAATAGTAPATSPTGSTTPRVAPAAAGPASGAGARLTPGPIPYPGSLVDGNVKSYGAKGDGRTDDTAAIRRALADGRGNPEGDYYGQPKALYFPAGTYLVSGTLEWNGCCVTLAGAGSSSTTIKLKDGAAGFASASAPRPVLRTPDGNLAFRHYIRDLRIDTGSRNPGAVGLDYISSNQGAVRNVVIRSGDGRGVTGLAMVRDWSGPQLITDVEVDGFDVGIREHNGQLSPVMEHVTVQHQRVAGVRTDYYLAVRALRSVNTVPAVVAPSGFLTLVDSSLTGGKGGPAVDTRGDLFARNITTSGYGAGIRRAGKVVAGAVVTEYASSAKALSGGRARSLNLPVRDTPRVAPGSAKSWSIASWSSGVAGLQAAVNRGRPQVLVPGGVYAAGGTVTVPAGVTLVRAFGTSVNGAGITFVVGSGSAPLRIEGFEYGVTVDQRGSRPVAVVDGQYHYRSSPGAGDLYLEDTIVEPLTVQKGQHVWARQLNDEYEATAGHPKILNNGGTLWILGLKTERKGTVIDTRGGATELLGGLFYPTQQFGGKEPPALSVTDGRASFSVVLQAFDPSRQYPVVLRASRGATVTSLPSRSGDAFALLTP